MTRSRAHGDEVEGVDDEVRAREVAGLRLAKPGEDQHGQQGPRGHEEHRPEVVATHEAPDRADAQASSCSGWEPSFRLDAGGSHMAGEQPPEDEVIRGEQGDERRQRERGEDPVALGDVGQAHEHGDLDHAVEPVLHRDPHRLADPGQHRVLEGEEAPHRDRGAEGCCQEPTVAEDCRDAVGEGRVDVDEGDVDEADEGAGGAGQEIREEGEPLGLPARPGDEPGEGGREGELASDAREQLHQADGSVADADLGRRVEPGGKDPVEQAEHGGRPHVDDQCVAVAQQGVAPVLPQTPQGRQRKVRRGASRWRPHRCRRVDRRQRGSLGEKRARRRLGGKGDRGTLGGRRCRGSPAIGHSLTYANWPYRRRAGPRALPCAPSAGCGDRPRGRRGLRSSRRG